jgi:hypothetical protein
VMASLWAVASLGVTADSELVVMSTLRGASASCWLIPATRGLGPGVPAWHLFTSRHNRRAADGGDRRRIAAHR